ncbi:MAG: GIY-YIG nuclease family protein [Rhodospirillales bacterium]
MTTHDELYTPSKRAGQRMLLTKWINTYKSAEEDGEKERAAQKLADVLAWAQSVGMSPQDIAEDRYLDLPQRTLELLGTGQGIGSPPDDAEIQEAVREVQSSVDTTNVIRLGEGNELVYVYGYACAPDRLKIGRTKNDVVKRIFDQINASTPDRPILRLVLSTSNPGALERALHGALILRARRVEGGGREWYRTTVAEILELYHALLGIPPQS